MADHQPDSESAREPQESSKERLATTTTETAPKRGLLAYFAELVLAGAVGTGIWVFGEHLTSHGHSRWAAVFNFLAFCVYFATVPITANRVWPHPKRIWALFAVFCVAMGLV